MTFFITICVYHLTMKCSMNHNVLSDPHCYVIWLLSKHFVQSSAFGCNPNLHFGWHKPQHKSCADLGV